MDLQTVLIIVLSLITLNLLVVGIYVVLVLKEFRHTMKKINFLLASAHHVTDALANPLAMVSGLAASVMQGFKLVNTIRDTVEDISLKGSDKEEDV